MHREGKCKKCGKCCLILMPDCAKRNLIIQSDGTYLCTIYNERPFIPCRTFPFLEHSEMIKSFDCGYSWVEDEDKTYANCINDGISMRRKIDLNAD